MDFLRLSSDFTIFFIEMLGIILIYNTIFNKDTFFNFKTAAILATICALILTLLFTLKSVKTIAVFMPIILIGITVSIYEKKKPILSICQILISSFFIILSESMLSVMAFLSDNSFLQNTFLFSFLMSIIISIIVIALNKYLIKNKFNYHKFISSYKLIYIIFLNIFLFFLMYKAAFDHSLLSNSLYIKLTLLVCLCLILNLYLFKVLSKILEEKAELETQNSYNPLLNNLMIRLRANDHEYKNHLNTLYSLIQLSNDENLKSTIENYIFDLEDETMITNLLYIDNIILKSILYDKFKASESLGIKFNCSITSNLSEINLKNSELTILLTNLINNAIESVEITNKKEIFLSISEDLNNYHISITNPIDMNNPPNINQIFKKGYSTKGDDRGYGLFNVKVILDKYKYRIQVYIEDNSLTIKLIL